jgi:hypothetical protein
LKMDAPASTVPLRPSIRPPLEVFKWTDWSTNSEQVAWPHFRGVALRRAARHYGAAVQVTSLLALFRNAHRSAGFRSREQVRSANRAVPICWRRYCGGARRQNNPIRGAKGLRRAGARGPYDGRRETTRSLVQAAWLLSLVVVLSSTLPEPRFPSVFPSPLCVTVCIVFERRYCFCGSDILLTFPESEPTTRGQSEPSPVLPPKRADEFVSGSRLTLGTALAPTLCSYARSCTRRERGAC